MNKENYKKAINQIHPSEELKNKTLEKMLKNENKKLEYLRYIAACAALLMVCLFTKNYLEVESDKTSNKLAIDTKIEQTNNDLPRFASMKQLKDILKENSSTNRFLEMNVEESLTDSVTKGDVAYSETQNSMVEDLATPNKEFSTTNVQVENVDEADIIKTDGDYIYHLANDKILIINANTLDVESIIDRNSNKKENENFSMSEIFINGDFLVVLGNSYYYEQNKTRTTSITDAAKEIISMDTAIVRGTQLAKARVYDVSDKSNPVLKREIELEGYYTNSRMIGDYVYFISSKSAYYTPLMKDEEILPCYIDSAISEEKNVINYTDIAYFEGTNNHCFTLVTGFNIKNQDEISIETFFGASGTVYASEKNLYLAQVTYNNRYYRGEKSTIYKFNLDNGNIVLQCKGEVKGDLNNQFSMDEYDGNLRIATTAYDLMNESTNQLYILDENLEVIAKIEDMARGEKIYAVRFIGKIGYVVTFKEIDPLFVIDLSEPTNPKIKGELKIPGYSSYLHPYDENHIIGIGYNTKSNGYGGITNANMKMSMFDVSDLENPKEMFSIDIGNEYAYSEITYNHKALFYHKDRNLIGFPVTLNEYYSGGNTNNFILYHIDLENGFQEYGRISQRINYKTNIDRAIYIGENLYTLSDWQLVSYNLNTMEKVQELLYPEY